MPQINLTAPSDYDSQMLAISRQQKLAEMLSQMGAQEIPVSSAGGISAPISPMSALAKGLSSFGGSYLAGQAENKAKDYEKSKLSDALMARMAGSDIDPNTLSSATSTTPEQPGFFDRAANFLGMGGNQEKPAIAGPAAPANTPTAPIDAEGTPTGTYMLPPTPASAPQPKNDAEGTPTSSYMPSQQPASPNAAPVLPYLAKLDRQAKYYTAYTPTTLQGRIDQQTGLMGIQQNRKDYLDNLPRYQALLAAAPDANRPQLQAAINTNNTALLDKYEGTQLDKSTPNAPNAMDAQRLEAFKQSNAARVAKGLPLESFDEYTNRMSINKFSQERAITDRSERALALYKESLGGKPSATEKLKQQSIDAWKAIPGNENGTVAQYDAYAAGLTSAAQTKGRIGATLSAEGSVPIDDPAVVAIASQLQNGSQVTVPPHLKNAVDRRMESLGDNAYTAVGAGRLINNAKSLAAPYMKLPEYQALASVTTPLNRIKAAMKAGHTAVSDQDMIDAMTQLSKASLQARAVTDSQAKLITGYGSWSDMASRFMNRAGGRGGALSDQQRKDIVKLSSAVAKEYQNTYGPVYNDLTTKLRANNIPEKFWPIPDLTSIQSGGKSVSIGANGPVPAHAKMSQAEWNTLEPDEVRHF